VWLGDPARPREALSLNTTAVAATTYNQAFFLEWQEFLDGVEHRGIAILSLIHRWRRARRARSAMSRAR